MDIISREQWGAQYVAGAGPAPLPAREVWLHHSVTVAPDLRPPFDDEEAAMRVLERTGQLRFGQGISYTFAVMPTGNVYEGHGVGTLGAHTRGRNSAARAIVLVGNYDADEPTAAQIESAAQLLVRGKREGWWIAVHLAGGHRQAPLAATACPGRHGMAVIDDINDRAGALFAGVVVDTARAPLPHDQGREPDVQLIELGNAAGAYVGWVVVDWSAGTYWPVISQLQLDLIRASGKVHLQGGRQPGHAIEGLRRVGAGVA